MSERWYEGTGDGPALIARGDRRRGRRVRRARPGAARAGRRGRGGSARGGRVRRRCSSASSTRPRATSRTRSRPGGCCRWTPVQTAIALDVDDGALPAARARARPRSRRSSRSPATLATIWSRVLYGDATAAELGRRARAQAAAEPPASAPVPTTEAVVSASRARSVRHEVGECRRAPLRDQPRRAAPRLRPPSAQRACRAPRTRSRAPTTGDRRPARPGARCRLRASPVAASPARRAGRRRSRRGRRAAARGAISWRPRISADAAPRRPRARRAARQRLSA